MFHLPFIRFFGPWFSLSVCRPWINEIRQNRTPICTGCIFNESFLSQLFPKTILSELQSLQKNDNSRMSDFERAFRGLQEQVNNVYTRRRSPNSNQWLFSVTVRLFIELFFYGKSTSVLITCNWYCFCSVPGITAWHGWRQCEPRLQWGIQEISKVVDMRVARGNICSNNCAHSQSYCWFVKQYWYPTTIVSFYSA